MLNYSRPIVSNLVDRLNQLNQCFNTCLAAAIPPNFTNPWAQQNDHQSPRHREFERREDRSSPWGTTGPEFGPICLVRGMRSPPTMTLRVHGIFVRKKNRLRCHSWTNWGDSIYKKNRSIRSACLACLPWNKCAFRVRSLPYIALLGLNMS